MPERRTSSVTSFISSLHFSGKVIMASILFGFGLLLVGAILLVIATGQQRGPPLQEDLGKKPMTFVGPGVMGVGAFFVIVGTIMCLIETRIFRKRKATDRDSLLNSEISPSTNALPQTTEFRDHTHGDGNKSRGEIEETEVKTVHVECHIQNIVEITEKVPTERGAQRKDDDEELSRSAAFDSSIYVDAVGESEDEEDDDGEQQSVTESTQFSTPPEGKLEEELKADFDSQMEKECDQSKIPDLASKGTGLTLETTKSTPEENTMSSLPPSDSAASRIPIDYPGKESDLLEGTLQPVHDSDDPLNETQKVNIADKERQEEEAQVMSSPESLDGTGKESFDSGADKQILPSSENAEPIVTHGTF